MNSLEKLITESPGLAVFMFLGGILLGVLVGMVTTSFVLMGAASAVEQRRVRDKEAKGINR